MGGRKRGSCGVSGRRRRRAEGCREAPLGREAWRGHRLKDSPQLSAVADRSSACPLRQGDGGGGRRLPGRIVTICNE